MLASHGPMPMRLRRSLLLASVFGGVVIALPAAAEQPSDFPPPCDASKVSRSDIERAHTVFLSGKQFLEESNYDKAISYFKDAYSIDCSVHAMLPIIATANERKGDKSEAVRALEEYLRRAPNAADHDVIERRIKNLKDQIGRDQAAAAAAAPPPAAAVPAAPAGGDVSATGTAPAAPATPPLPRESEGHSALPWVVVGVGGATFVAGLLLYAVGAGDVSSALNACKGMRSPCPSQGAVDQGNSGRTLEQIGAPVMGGGLALAAAGLVWHFLEKPADASPRGVAALRLEPVITASFRGASVGMSF